MRKHLLWSYVFKAGAQLNRLRSWLLAIVSPFPVTPPVMVHPPDATAYVLSRISLRPRQNLMCTKQKPPYPPFSVQLFPSHQRSNLLCLRSCISLCPRQRLAFTGQNHRNLILARVLHYLRLLLGRTNRSTRLVPRRCSRDYTMNISVHRIWSTTFSYALI